ncbi:hypothetical protein CLOP_g12136 [Closterium sp. NIES-67]|nr:hypothetical protein CLOP_g12136 [Closterium sp. NIES-67]
MSSTPAARRTRSPSPAASASAGSGDVVEEEGGDEGEWAEGMVGEEEDAEEETEEGAAEGGEVGGTGGRNQAGQKRGGFRRPSMLPQPSPSAPGAPLSRTAAAAAASAAALKALGPDVWRLSGKLHVLALLLRAVFGEKQGRGGARGVPSLVLLMVAVTAAFRTVVAVAVVVAVGIKW